MHNRRSFGIIRGVNHPSPDWREVANGKTARGTRWACVAVNGGGKPNCANIALYALCAAFCAVLDGRVALCRDLGRDEARPSREGHARPLAALRVRFAQATRRLRRGRILSRPRTGRSPSLPARSTSGRWRSVRPSRRRRWNGCFRCTNLRSSSSM